MLQSEEESVKVSNITKARNIPWISDMRDLSLWDQLQNFEEWITNTLKVLLLFT